jgi:hypothetical protein
MEWSNALARLIQAAALHLRGGHRERVVAHLEDAGRRFDAVGMALHAAATRRCLGRMLGGEAGREMARRADKWMAAEGIKNPEKMTAMIAPGLSRAT